MDNWEDYEDIIPEEGGYITSKGTNKSSYNSIYIQIYIR